MLKRSKARLRSAAILLALLPASARAGGSLIVNFEGMQSDRGELVAALVDSADDFLRRQKQPRHSFGGNISGGLASWRIDDLPFGRYAISAFHDVNRNGELDSGLFGIPVEDYGFSNNARASFGPPDFADAAFDFTASGQVLSIWIR